MPLIGYDKAAEIAKANNDGVTLKEAALATGYVSEADYDHYMDPTKLMAPRS